MKRITTNRQLQPGSFARLTLSTIAMFWFASTAQAGLIFESFTSNTGTGFGNTFTILSLQEQGNGDDVETGAVISVGGVDQLQGPDISPGPQNQTRTLSELLVTDPSEFRLLFDATEPGGNKNAITIDALEVSFYSDTSVLLLTQSLMPAPLILANTNSGNGTDDAVFRLDTAGIAAAQAAFAPFNPIGAIRVGVSATLSDAQGGPDSFAGAMGPGTTHVPEPTTLALLGIGLLGAGVSTRRHKQS